MTNTSWADRAGEFDWGDVPTWLTAIGSLTALVFAAFAVVAASRTYRIESARDRINAEDRRAQQDHLRRSQAALVSAWWGTNDTRRPSRRWGTFVRNASDAPVYRGHVTVLNRRGGDPVKKLDLPVVPPEERPTFHEIPLDAAHGITMDEHPDDDVRVRLTFTDAAGVRWMRNEYGHLSELDPELVIWVHDRIAAVLERFATEFRNAYGVSLSCQTSVFAELQDEFVERSAVSGVDAVLAPHDWAGNLAYRGVVDPVVISDHGLNYFSPEAVESLSVDGMLYAVPAMIDTVVLYRNIDLVPDPPRTFDELVAIGTVLQEAGHVAEIVALQVGPRGDPFHLHPLYSSAGGWLFGRQADGSWDLGTIGVAAPESVAAFERIRALGERGAGVLRRDIDEPEATRLFIDGETAFLVTTSWGAAHARKAGVPYAATPVPPFEQGSRPEPLVAVYGFFVAAHGRNRMLAEDLVADFLTRPEVTEAMADELMAVVPTTHVHRRDQVLDTVADECRRGRLMPAVPQMKEVWRILGDAEAAVIAGEEVVPITHRLEAELRDAVTRPRASNEVDGVTPAGSTGQHGGS